MQGSSELPGFYKLSMEDRLKLLQKLAGLMEEEVKTLGSTGGLPSEVANRMIENVVGGMTLPLGMATNFLVNGKDYVVPMALEEPSVVAAASNAAKIARVKGGFKVTNTGPIMIRADPDRGCPRPQGRREEASREEEGAPRQGKRAGPDAGVSRRRSKGPQREGDRDDQGTDGDRRALRRTAATRWERTP